MNAAVLEAKAAIGRLARQAESIMADKSLDYGRKKSAMDKLEAELNQHAATLKTWQGALGAVSGFDMRDAGGAGTGAPAFYGTKSLGGAPSIAPSKEQIEEMHDAVLSRKSMRIELKTTPDPSAFLPSALVPGIVGMRHESQRVLSFIPSSPISAPSWEYVRHVSTTGTATTVAPGGLKPNVDLVTDQLTGTVRKIAATTTVLDESLADFSGFASYVSTELTRIYIDTENAQLLNGDGTGTNILGLLRETGILTRDAAADATAGGSSGTQVVDGRTVTGLDTLEMASTDLRVGSAFATADLIVMHPTTWSKLRRTKDAQGHYIVESDPTRGEAASIWGIPVLTTTSIPVGTAMVARLADAAEARIRQGITLDITPYDSDDWSHNRTKFRVEGRLGLAAPRPSAILKVINL